MSELHPRVRPKGLTGSTLRVGTGCGNMYVTLNNDSEGPFEVFAHLGKAGSCGKCQIEGIMRAVSIGLRCGVSATEYVKQLTGLRCPNPHSFPLAERTYSCPDGIARAMSRHWKIPYSELVLAPAQQEAIMNEEAKHEGEK